MDFSNVPNEAVAGSVVGVPAIWLFIKRILLIGASSSTEKRAVEASGDVIQMLRDEVCRLGEINGDLASELNKLQKENVSLRKEISNLHDTINGMTEQISTIMRGNQYVQLDQSKRDAS